MAKVTMPQLGESVAEGTIGRWLKQPGDPVEKWEPLLEIITDKVNAEVPSPYAGVLKEILVEEGASVPNNAAIAVIETPEEAASTGPGDRPTLEPPAAAAVAEPAGGAEVRLTPAVRKLLQEHSLEPSLIAGTGGGGRITREDVLAYVEAHRAGNGVAAPSAPSAPSAASAPSAPSTASTASAASGPSAPQASTAPQAAPAAPSAPSALAPAPSAPAPSIQPAAAPSSLDAVARSSAGSIEFPAGTDEILLPMTQMRKGIAVQMARALQIPHAYMQVEADVTGLVRLRTSLQADYRNREGIPLSYVPFVIKAVVEALKRHGTFNAHWTDQGILAKRRINIGVAVAVDEGLLVPVIRDVDQLSINGINRAIADLSARARANKMRLDDFGAGTFTVDNTGWLGANMTMPIINAPEVAILTMEAIAKRPVVVERPDGDVIAIRPVMNMVLGIDHRANDGAQAGAFLRAVKGWLEGAGPGMSVY